MSELSFKNLKIFDMINKQSNMFIRTPEPTELGELDSMYRLADLLYYAYLNDMVSQEIYIYIYIYKFIKLSRYHTRYRQVSS